MMKGDVQETKADNGKQAFTDTEAPQESAVMMDVDAFMMDKNDDKGASKKPGNPEEERAAKTATHAPGKPEASTNKNNRKWRAILLIVAGIVVIVVTVVLSVVLTRPDSETSEEDPDVAIDFTTGVSLVTGYAINATISSRLARTVLTIDVSNALDCSSIHGVTLQMPMAARVASLKTLSNDGCKTHGESQALKQARETFLETAAEGLPAAYVEARDSFTYSLQVAMPPLGTTRVELVLEELLRLRVGEVKFQLPFVPNEKVDKVVLDLNIEDIYQPPNANSSEVAVDLDLGPTLSANVTPQFHLDIPDAREHNLRTILNGKYIPGQLPVNGILYNDEACVEHFFRPTNLEPMPKNIFLLVDISDDVSGATFGDAKTALKTLIDSLDPADTLTIQTFAQKGTEQLLGSNRATVQEKAQAKRFIDGLRLLRHGGTNLHEAFLEGLLRAESAADADKGSSVTVLVVLSASWASHGETDRARIAQHIWKKNQKGKVKLFSLGLEGADTELLSAIAIMNGGVATSILGGPSGSFISQMEDFFASEFGRILLSDIQVSFSDGAVSENRHTPHVFPLLADGTEISVRGLLQNSSAQSSLQAITTATTKDGRKKWTATSVKDPATPTPGFKHSRCFQSYAHARINQLLRLRDAAKLLGDEVIQPLVSLTRTCDDETSLADCIEAEALDLAIQANLVARGLTAMVTVDDDQCLSSLNETEICIDGTNRGEYWDRQEDGSTQGAPPPPMDNVEAHSTGSAEATSFALAIIVLFALSCLWLS